MFKTGLISSRTFQTAALFAAMLVVCRSGTAATPIVNTATVDPVANTLTFSGSNLLGSDGAGVYGVVIVTPPIQLTVASSSTTSVVANFPSSSPASSLAAGTYTALLRFLINPLTSTTAVSQIVVPFTVLPAGSTPPPVNPPNNPPSTGTTTNLLFPYISTTPPIYSSIAITNLSTPTPSATSVTTLGTCILTFYGAPSGPAPITINGIAPGSVYTTNLWQQQVGIFQGYILAACNFKAQGVAFGTVVPPTTSSAAPAYAAPSYAIPAIVQ